MTLIKSDSTGTDIAEPTTITRSKRRFGMKLPAIAAGAALVGLCMAFMGMFGIYEVLRGMGVMQSSVCTASNNTVRNAAGR